MLPSNKINHLAMIMDGNKRWADLHGASLKEGYQKGLNKLKEIISVCLLDVIKSIFEIYSSVML